MMIRKFPVNSAFVLGSDRHDVSEALVDWETVLVLYSYP